MLYCLISVNVKADHKIKFQEMTKRGQKYLEVVDYNIKLNPEKSIFNFENLFNGEKQLGEAMNRVLNQYDKEIFQDVGAGYGQSFALIGKQIANNFFTKIPKNKIFISEK